LVTVTAPASTANLGPGFDHLAAAVSLSLELRTREGTGWTYTHEGSGPPDSPPDGSLVRRAIEAVLGEPSTHAIVAHSSIPVGRGLGSSGAAVVAGLLMGYALKGVAPDPIELLRLGTGLEGHADNVAASLYGGLVNVVATASGTEILRFKPDRSVRPLILLPRETVATTEARSVLPLQVDRDDAVSTSSRAAALLAMLTGAASVTAAGLWEYTSDVLHQPYREPLMPRTAETLAGLRASGIAAAISGAGPSIVCFALRGEEQGVRSAVSKLDGWELLDVDWNTEGAKIVQR
jgi:homoserine kinase